MKFSKEAELIIIGYLYEQPERLFKAHELCNYCYGRLTTHQIGHIVGGLVRKGFVNRVSVVESGSQVRYGAVETILDNPDGNEARALSMYLSNLYP